MNLPLLCMLGHVATRRDLESTGLSRSQISALARGSDVRRPRRGTFVCRHLSEAEATAAAVGGRLDCVAVLARHAIWVGHTNGLHIRMPAHAGAASRHRLEQTRHALSATTLGVLGSRRLTVHWSSCTPPAIGRRLEVPVLFALRQAMTCLPPDDYLGAVESAIHLGQLTRAGLDELIGAAPARLGPLLSQLVPGAQSGYETIARLRLRRAGHAVEIQVPVRGVGHVDLLIDGVVVLEIDGREFHADTFETDRARDLGTEGAGLRTLRIAAVWVDTRWEEVLAVIERMVSDAKGGAARVKAEKRGRTGADSR